MIENDEQLRISQEWLRGFRAKLKRLQKKYPNPAEFEFYPVGVRDHVEQIERDVAAYLAAKEVAR